MTAGVGAPPGRSRRPASFRTRTTVVLPLVFLARAIRVAVLPPDSYADGACGTPCRSAGPEESPPTRQPHRVFHYAVRRRCLSEVVRLSGGWSRLWRGEQGAPRRRPALFGRRSRSWRQGKASLRLGALLSCADGSARPDSGFRIRPRADASSRVPNWLECRTLRGAKEGSAAAGRGGLQCRGDGVLGAIPHDHMTAIGPGLKGGVIR